MVNAVRPTLFVCPRCGARYKVARAEARGSADREIACLACDGPLVAREGEFVLKYFLVDAPGHRQKRSA